MKSNWFVRRRRVRIGMLVLVAAFSTTAVFSTTAGGRLQRATKGDATAVLEAFGNGGWAVLLHSKQVNGTPSNGLCCGGVAIRPFFTPFNGTHYCSLDWHTIVLADIEPGPHQQADAATADLAVSFMLDGAPLATTRTALKRFLHAERFGLADAYYRQYGQVMAPSDLVVGTHSLSVVATNAAGTIVYYTDGITFFVDAPGAGACL